MMNNEFALEVGVIGGAGHVGLPLSLMFADCGLPTVIVDIDRDAVEKIRSGVMPFHEDGADELLQSVLERDLLTASTSPEKLSECRFIICIIGTPVDEHLNPSFESIRRTLQACIRHFRDGQTLILRSTVFPGISDYVQRFLREEGLNISVAFCPERIAQGKSIVELRELPQIISAFDDEALAAVRELFGHFVSEFIEMSPKEAELCKLMTNAWRYLQFAAVNQFYMIATQNDLDFDRILHGCRHNYPRMAGMPGPGLAAGPCLVKDTMQLAAFSQNNFVLGHAAMLVNEGLPAHLIELAEKQTNLIEGTAGILGLAFKAECDDPRDSLSYKLRKLLMLKARRVLWSDPFVDDPGKSPLQQVVDESDVLFIATPHRAYRDLVIPADKVVVDVWNCLPTRSTAELAR